MAFNDIERHEGMDREGLDEPVSDEIQIPAITEEIFNKFFGPQNGEVAGVYILSEENDVSQ